MAPTGRNLKVHQCVLGHHNDCARLLAFHAQGPEIPYALLCVFDNFSRQRVFPLNAESIPLRNWFN
jgi:hypothetical protein